MHPFAVAVFKNLMYWDDWNAQGIFMADKNRGTGLTTIASRLPGVMDLKVNNIDMRSMKNVISYFVLHADLFAKYAPWKQRVFQLDICYVSIPVHGTTE